MAELAAGKLPLAEIALNAQFSSQASFTRAFHRATGMTPKEYQPVVVVEVVDTPEQAVEAANRTMYGLTSSILAGDTYRAFELAPKILAGIVNVNSPTVNDEIHAPMGGVRDSGWGRTGPDSLKEFQDVIWINSHSGQRQYPI
jgi:acyl-CoA reductase-like NAD-dependent aldehyde dehydrogenase